MVNGLLVLLPKLDRLLLSWMLGMPHEFLSVTLKGTPISSSTFSTPANCWAMLLYKELYPKRASFTLVAEKTRTFETTHWLARVYVVLPSRVRPGLTVNSSVQL